jgi:hypothetical protein
MAAFVLYSFSLILYWYISFACLALTNFISMLPCNVIDFFLNNQPDAPIIQIYSVIKLYMFRASSLSIIMEFSTVHSTLVSFMQVFDDHFQAESGWNAGWTLLGIIKNLHETYQCRMYSRKLHDNGQRRCPKHVEFHNRINLDNWCVWLVIWN